MTSRALLVLLLLRAAAAAAQDNPADCRIALQSLQQGWQTERAPDSLFRIGRCHYRLGDGAAAKDALFQFLQLAPASDLAPEAFAIIAAIEAAEGKPGKPPPPPPAPVHPPGGVQLTLHADNPLARVEQLTSRVSLSVTGPDIVYDSSGNVWTDLCGPPCGVAVPPGSELRINGLDVSPSQPFAVPPGRNQLILDVKTGSPDRRLASGIVGISAGGATLVGLSFLLLSTVPQTSSDQGATSFNNGVNGTKETLRGIGIAGLVVGVSGLLVAAGLYASSRTTVAVQ
jgi:hypothetical protein